VCDCNGQYPLRFQQLCDAEIGIAGQSEPRVQGGHSPLNFSVSLNSIRWLLQQQCLWSGQHLSKVLQLTCRATGPSAECVVWFVHGRMRMMLGHIIIRHNGSSIAHAC
jgi:hypothetical protein